MRSKPRSIFHEVTGTVSPGFWFGRRFCFKCEQTKPAKGGKRQGPGNMFFVCADCINPKETA
jgi:hypothetical protein